ncbi:MAG: 16S rRNA methyltransferase [Thermoprotei archaeon]|nr:MAG: 16S rRNA methyltransferase [Thermoprotei archaeon]RLF20410.1 MAG: 16S rRNA methyltransferase [Thermoprotei archaeon]
MLHLVLAEAALETIPMSLWKHPLIRKYAKKRGKGPGALLLDLSFHYSAAKKLKDIEKRGRPDIVHLALLEALGSPLNKVGLLKVYVHTYANYLIYIRPDVRLPRNYLRFVGLMEQLLEVGKVPPDSDNPLLIAKKGDLSDLIGEIAPTKVILMTEEGEKMKLMELGKLLLSMPKPLVIIGAFQRGDFKKETKALSDLKISIFDESLDAWTVVSRVITAYEIAKGIV